MCSAEKCCFYIPLGVACYFIGGTNFIVSITTIVMAVMMLLRDGPVKFSNSHHHIKHHMQNIFNVFELSKESFDIIMWLILLGGVVQMLFTVVFIIGLATNKPNFVLSFFGFSIMATIILLIGGLLELIHIFWISAFATIIIALINLHFSVVVHAIYEEISRGRKFSIQNLTSRTMDDEAPILDEFEDSST